MAAITVGETRDALPPGTVLLGGAAGLGRPVTGTATFRARMPAFPALHGGEVALVPLSLLRQVDPNAHLDRLVAQLAQAGIAALVLVGAVGRSNEQVTRAANAHGLPVFCVPAGPTPEQLDLALHRHLAGQREALLRRSQELQQEFAQLALAGRGLDAIVERLAAVTGLPAAWETPTALEPLAWSVPPAGWSPPPELSPATRDAAPGTREAVPALLRAARLPLQRWLSSLSTADARLPEVASLALRADEVGAASSWRRLVVPVHAGGERANNRAGMSTHGMSASALGGGEGVPDSSRASGAHVAGYLSLISPEHLGGAETRLALTAAALAASIEVLRARTASAAQGSAVAALIHDWLAGRLNPSELAARALQLDVTLSPPFAVAVIETDQSLAAEDFASLSAALAGRASPAAQATPAPSAPQPVPAHLSAAVGDDRVALIVSVPSETALDTANPRLHSALVTRAALVSARDGLTDGSAAGASNGSGATVFAGIGSAARQPDDVPRAYGEALQALAVARRLGGQHRVAYFGTLGVYRVLAATAPDELAGFRREALGPLLRMEERTGAELLRTLEAYLLCGGSPQETAQRLHTHRNTVLYRLQRIGEALGVDVRAPEAQFTLWLALRAGDVLGLSEPTATPAAPSAGAATRPRRTAPPKQAVA